MSYYRIGDFHVLPSKEAEFEELVRKLLVDTRGMATDRVHVFLIRSAENPLHYCLAGLWETASQYEGIQESSVRKEFEERVKRLLSRPRSGELFEVVAQEP